MLGRLLLVLHVQGGAPRRDSYYAVEELTRSGSPRFQFQVSAGFFHAWLSCSPKCGWGMGWQGIELMGLCFSLGHSCHAGMRGNRALHATGSFLVRPLAAL